jgi:DNA gyrase subunit B
MLQIERQHHGLGTTQSMSSQQLAGAELRPLIEAAGALADLVQAGARIERGGRSQPIERFDQAHQWLMDEAKRGRTIQRFKGLGEMNPEQLWETTVNPETRRLLKVRIEDAVAADQIFSTLMGDVVEPRRDFIEENALKVSNLDV